MQTLGFLGMPGQSEIILIIFIILVTVVIRVKDGKEKRKA